MFCLKTFIWTRKKQLRQPCHNILTRHSNSFSHQLQKQYTKEKLLKKLHSNKTFWRHLMFSYGVFVEYLTKFRISFVSKSNIGGNWGFYFKKYASPKKVSSDTSNTFLAILAKHLHQISVIFRYNSENK